MHSSAYLCDLCGESLRQVPQIPRRVFEPLFLPVDVGPAGDERCEEVVVVWMIYRQHLRDPPIGGNANLGKIAAVERRVASHDPVKRTITGTIVEKRFLDSKDSTRKGMPDEARPVIRLEMGDGQTKEVSRWERDRDEGVDALRAIFRDLIRRAKATAATSGGIVDPKWRPPGWE